MIRREVSVSVRNLVEFILRNGDIDTSKGTFSDTEAMQQGSRAHRKIQKEAGPSYASEVPLKHETVVDDSLTIIVSGRADGIFSENSMASDETGLLRIKETYTIDEIKGTYRNIGRITVPELLHEAQAKCYAWFFCFNEDLEDINVQVTYVSLKKGTIKKFSTLYSRDDLEEWYKELIMKYAVWVKWQLAWWDKRNTSIDSGSFPFEWRESQKRMASGVYNTIMREKKLFVLAPTGTGKTIGTIYPSLKAIGQGKADKLFYLTAKTIARTVAENAFSMLAGKGFSIKFVTLTARDKICIFDKAACLPEKCPRAKGHFDRINEAVFDIISHEDSITRECIEKYAEKHMVCPFEMALDISLWTDCVICDYNYVFDPDVSLKRFFSDSAGSYIFLIDEAHNLVERARDIYSGELSYLYMKSCAKELKGIDKTLSRYINRTVNEMQTMKRASDEECEVTESVSMLVEPLTNLNETILRILKDDYKGPSKEELTDLFFTARSFIMAYERSDSRYMDYVIRNGNEMLVKIRCMDPSKDLGERLKSAKSSVLFSATLLPVNYYKEMLSDTCPDDFELSVESPFDKANQLVLAASDVSTKYSRRGEKEYTKISDYIRKIIRAKHGNYLVFFPSYKVMTDVFEIFAQTELASAGHGLKVIVQEADMSEDARQEFLDGFTPDPHKSVIGFCVMGGIFSEGIDLTEDRLIGVIIAGTGLPMVTKERELLKDYFDKAGTESKANYDSSGFEYAYLYPGMNKVLQAGGRVIRTAADCGVIALLDERFNYYQYRKLFPKEWTDYKKTDLMRIEEQLDAFWESRDKGK